MTFEEEFAAAELKHILISVRGAREDRNGGFDPGRMIEGAYKVVAGQVIMCDAKGNEVIDADGRKYRHVLKDKDANGKPISGEPNEREAASRMVKDIKSNLKINGADRVGGFEYGPLHYRRNGSIY